MELHNVDPNELRDLFEPGPRAGLREREIVDEINRYASLEALVDDTEE